jgi:poly-gamma-glutamate synthesis protein (capsule biosynthesis protein)
MAQSSLDHRPVAHSAAARARRWIAGAGALLVLAAGCSGSPATRAERPTGPGAAGPSSAAASSAASSPPSSSAAERTDTRPPGEFTIALAGDVHFEDRTADRLAADPATAFGVAAPVLSAADLTMVNLETSISVGGTAANKSFTFQAPPTAFDALRDAGVDVATMANNHAADYGADGLDQTLAAITASGFPTVGIGPNAAAAYAPWYTTLRGVRVAIIAASQVQDETLRDFTAGPDSPGIASAYSQQLIDSVTAARAQADVVLVYLHWGTEYDTCPNDDQQSLADELAAAGATAVVGTHAHVLQGAGWRDDGTYVAYGLGNYLWWMSFGNNQDDNGVLTLTFRANKVADASFAPAQLDDTGVPVPAIGDNAQRIDDEWDQARACAGLSATAPS